MDDNLRRSWEVTRGHLARARSFIPLTSVAEAELRECQEWLDHNELELALDALATAGDRFPAPAGFWDALRAAAQNMGLTDRAQDLGWLEVEARCGYLRAELYAQPTDQGGRRTPFISGYRPDWGIGNVYEGRPTINGAAVTIEGRRSMSPGETGLVRLHPLVQELWLHVQTGAQIQMYEGPHLVGIATILEILKPVEPEMGA